MQTKDILKNMILEYDGKDVEILDLKEENLRLRQFLIQLYTGFIPQWDGKDSRSTYEQKIKIKSNIIIEIISKTMEDKIKKRNHKNV